MPKKYIIKCYTPVENNSEFETKKEAEEEIEHLKEMQHENIYEIESVELDDLSCIKCGKHLSIAEHDQFEGLCRYCWEIRN